MVKFTKMEAKNCMMYLYYVTIFRITTKILAKSISNEAGEAWNYKFLGTILVLLTEESSAFPAIFAREEKVDFNSGVH